MEGLLVNFGEIIEKIKLSECKIDPSIKEALIHIYKSLLKSGKKITCASKFIDFFVHDILDYTLLSKDSNNFTKNFTVFNIHEAVKEIIEI